MTFPRVSPAEAHRLLVEEGYVYLDVRTAEEFAEGHPQGAYNVPIVMPAPHGMAENAHFVRIVQCAFPERTKVVVGCQSGNRSQTAARRLIEAGFTYVVEQRAGFAGSSDPFGRPGEPGWKKQGLPCATRPEPGRDYPTLAAKASQ